MPADRTGELSPRRITASAGPKNKEEKVSEPAGRKVTKLLSARAHVVLDEFENNYQRED